MQDPIGSFLRIRDFFISYLDTAFRIDDPAVAEERRALLKRAGNLCTEPLIEPVLRYRPETTSSGQPLGFNDIRLGLADIDKVLEPRDWNAFVDLVLAGLFPSLGNSFLDREPKYPPYAHQVRMLRRGLQEGRPGVVTSGTGSGKTEAFLLPLLAQLVQEGRRWERPTDDFLERNWWHDPKTGSPYTKPNKEQRQVARYTAIPTEKRPTKQHPQRTPFEPHRKGERRPAAIRALILYPMNALVEDQMVRLRKSLDSSEARAVQRHHLNGNQIFFGRYTGSTPVTGHHVHPGFSRLFEGQEDGSIRFPEHKKADETGHVSYDDLRESELERRKRQLEKLFDAMVELEQCQTGARHHAADIEAERALDARLKEHRASTDEPVSPEDFVEWARAAGWRQLDRLRAHASRILGEQSASTIDSLLQSISRQQSVAKDAASAFDADDAPFVFPSTDGGEMTNRWDMQATPPDILITNVSMLSAMLNREVEQSIFDKTRTWLTENDDAYFYLILDELHLQRGSAGTEVAYLLRLLLYRLGLTNPAHQHKVRILASSASLPAEPEKEAEKSASYLWDMFGWYGLGRTGGMSEQEGRIAWLDSISPGQPFAPEDPSNELWPVVPLLDLLRVHQENAPYGRDGTLFSIDPTTDAAVADAWRALAKAIGVTAAGNIGEAVSRTIERISIKLLHACNDGERFRATTSTHVAERVFRPEELHTMNEAQHLELVRALTLARGLGDGLEHLTGPMPDHVSSFRIHTFFRSIEGLYAPAQCGLGSPAEFLVSRQSEVGVLTMDKAPRIRIDESDTEVRLFELTYCECCGELFLGGMTSREKFRGRQLPLVELLPTEPNLEGLPDEALSQRFEELSARDYGIFWPRAEREPLIPDNDSKSCHDAWKQASLERRTGAVLRGWKDDQARFCRGWLFRRQEGQDKHKRTIQSAGTNAPYACPRCGTSYFSRITTDYRLSPLRNFRTGFGKTTQLLATELFDAQRTAGRATEHDAKLVSFSDSRQDAARASLSIERNHHQDLRRELLVKCLRDAAVNRADEDEIRAEIATWEGLESNPSRSVQTTARERLSALRRQLRDTQDSSIPLSAIIEPAEAHYLATTNLPVSPLVRSMVELGVHPYDPAGRDRPVGGVRPDELRFPWTGMFEVHPDGLRWRDGAETTRERRYQARLHLVEQVQQSLSEVIFSKTYFSLEEAGLGYPTVGTQQGFSQDQRYSLDALIRVLSDDYRYRPNLYGNDELPEWRVWGEVTSARIKKLVARLWDDTPQNRFVELLAALGRARHSGGIVRLSSLRIQLTNPGDSYVRCASCARVHLHPGWGRCTRCAMPLDWERRATRPVEELWGENFLARRIERAQGDALGTFRLHCEELTGQTEYPARRQQTFKGIFLPRFVEESGNESDDDDNGDTRLLMLEDMDLIQRRRAEIDLLAVTTTMEVGIDIGPLQAVLQANMPPQRFNYQQRVGRAGRRGQAFSIALTVCRTRSHDVYYFGMPEKITGDVPPPPFLTRTLDPIARRFLLKGWLWKAFSDLRAAVRKNDGRPYPADLQSPPDIHGEYLPTNFLNKSDDTDSGQSWCDRVMVAVANAGPFAETLETLLAEGGKKLEAPFTTQDVRYALNKAMEQGRQGSLAHDLAELGELPMYGMPTRVRDLYLRLRKRERGGLEEWSRVDRDLDLAIYEFAPGSTLVIDKAEYLSVGFTPVLSDPIRVRGGQQITAFRPEPFGEQLQLAECPSCHAWTQIVDAEPICEPCGQPLDDAGHHCVVPNAFRTDLARFPRTHGDASKHGIRHRSIQAEGKSISLQTVDNFGPNSNWRIQLANARGRTFRINRGPIHSEAGRGFITVLGAQDLSGRRGRRLHLPNQVIDERYMDPEKFTPGFQPSSESSQPLWLTAPKTTEALYLSPNELPEFLAIDTLPSRSDATPSEMDNARAIGLRAAAISATFLIVGRAALRLDVDPEEFDVLEPRIYGTTTRLPLLHITDHLVNGAGLCARLGSAVDDDIPLVVELIRSILQDENEYPLNRFLASDHQGCDESCYRCLQRYGNSPYHALLDWQLGLAFLRAMVDSTYVCGLDGNLEVPELRRFGALVESRADEMNLRFGAGSNTRGRFGRFEAFRIQVRKQLSPWVLVVHPLWYTFGPPEDLHPDLREAAEEARLDAEAAPLFWDTFNLSRRPGFVRERIKSASS